MSDINKIRERIINYHNKLCGYFIDRDEILKMMITATAAQEPLLFVGRPGTAKSLLVTAFCQGLGLSEGNYFEYMLTKFTEPSEVMGPIDIRKLKEGSFTRKISGHLPVAKVAFLDEIFKANSAILNMLLTIINERKYYQEGRPEPVPLIMLFGASNEIPDFGEFDALKDRFILKAETLPVKDLHFDRLIRQGVSFETEKKNRNTPWKGSCSLEDFVILHDHVTVNILPKMAENNEFILYSEKMTRVFKALISTLEKELRVEITDRKLIKLYKLIVTQAFLFNGGEVKYSDLKILAYCANDFKDIKKIRQKVTDYLETL